MRKSTLDLAQITKQFYNKIYTLNYDILALFS